VLGLSFLSLLEAYLEDLFWYSCETSVTLFQGSSTGTKQGPFRPVLKLGMNHTSHVVRSGEYGGLRMTGIWFLLNTAPL